MCMSATPGGLSQSCSQLPSHWLAWSGSCHHGDTAPGRPEGAPWEKHCAAPLPPETSRAEPHQRHTLGFIEGAAPQSQYKNTKSPISLITIKNPQNGKLRDQEEAPGAGAQGAPLRHQAWPQGPRYCCCYEVGGSDCPVGATVCHAAQGPSLLLGCAQLLHASDLVQQARDEGLDGRGLP